MIPSLPRLLTCSVALALLAGCAHQQLDQSGAETRTVDAATPLEISPLAESQAVTRERRVVTGPNPPRRGIVDPDVYDNDLIPVEVLRTGRYQLVTTRAPLGQRHLLEQVVNVRVPPSVLTTVGDGIRYTLQHTGFSLCEPTHVHQRWLFSRPLPATHYRLGPMPLREALQVLAGDAWELEADPVRRQVCYEQRDIRTVETVETVAPVAASGTVTVEVSGE